jgi:hypothetical protein
MNKALLLAAVVMLAATAYAQEPDPAFSHHIKIQGAKTPNLQFTVFTGAPAGFNPVTASPEELMTYGYPRRPDINDKKAYERWLKEAFTTRVDAQLEAIPGKYHVPNHRVKTLGTVQNTTNSTSGNWSGFSLVGGSPKFDEVVGDWIVPNVNAQFSNIKGYSSMWVGIDGNCSCNDLIQDGTEHDWVHGTVTYDAWIEFIPEPEMIIHGFGIQPGDVISATSSVVIKGGKTYGVFFLTNFNTKQSFSGQLLMPSGDSWAGQSAEWIVERTEVGGTFENPMPNYGLAYMDNAWAYRVGSARKITYLSEPNENITMVDSSGKHLSRSYVQDSDSMWFQWLAY